MQIMTIYSDLITLVITDRNPKYLKISMKRRFFRYSVTVSGDTVEPYQIESRRWTLRQSRDDAATYALHGLCDVNDYIYVDGPYSQIINTDAHTQLKLV